MSLYIFLLYTNYLNGLKSELCLISPTLKALKKNLVIYKESTTLKNQRLEFKVQNPQRLNVFFFQ